jgi:predicted DCC family thiol-disulfide oxidoreductase YuxK
MSDNGPVLFFDGVCNLCNAAVQFVIRHDKGGKVRFASLQSKAGQVAKDAILTKKGSVPDSLIFLEHGTYYTESDAALRLAKYLDGGWKNLRYLRIFPGFLRDAVYRLVARNRYRMFGKQDACMLPTPELKQRFLAE